MDCVGCMTLLEIDILLVWQSIVLVSVALMFTLGYI